VEVKAAVFGDYQRANPDANCGQNHSKGRCASSPSPNAYSSDEQSNYSKWDADKPSVTTVKAAMLKPKLSENA
jgi:hypothetical protein